MNKQTNPETAPGTDNPAAPRDERALEMSIMYTISSVVVVVISGFALYRWQTDDTRGAIINLIIVSMVAMVMLLARFPRFSGLSLKLFGLTTATAAILSSELVSSNGLLWAMLVLLVNAMTLERRWAIGLNVLVIIVLTASTHLYESLLQQVSWTTVAILITAFSQVSMDQLRQQRQLLAEQANADPLTGAGNRRLMRQQLEELTASRRKLERDASLMAVDLDNFKSINDLYGHESGDRVLKDFVKLAQESLRADDGFYRIGGEEFVMLLRGMDEITARAYLPDLHEKLTGKVQSPGGPIEFSAGVATLHENEDWSHWLARADRALYEAKDAGRNRLVFFRDAAAAKPGR